MQINQIDIHYYTEIQEWGILWNNQLIELFPTYREALAFIEGIKYSDRFVDSHVRF